LLQGGKLPALNLIRGLIRHFHLDFWTDKDIHSKFCTVTHYTKLFLCWWKIRHFGSAYPPSCTSWGKILHGQVNPHAARPCQIVHELVHRFGPAGWKCRLSLWLNLMQAVCHLAAMLPVILNVDITLKARQHWRGDAKVISPFIIMTPPRGIIKWCVTSVCLSVYHVHQVLSREQRGLGRL